MKRTRIKIASGVRKNYFPEREWIESIINGRCMYYNEKDDQKYIIGRALQEGPLLFVAVLCTLGG